MLRAIWAGIAAGCFLLSFGAIYQDKAVVSFLWWTLGAVVFVVGVLRPERDD